MIRILIIVAVWFLLVIASTTVMAWVGMPSSTFANFWRSPAFVLGGVTTTYLWFGYWIGKTS